MENADLKFDRRFDSPISTTSHGSGITPISEPEKRVGGGMLGDAAIIGVTLAIIVLLVIILFWLVDFMKTLGGEHFTVKNEHADARAAPAEVHFAS